MAPGRPVHEEATFSDVEAEIGDSVDFVVHLERVWPEAEDSRSATIDRSGHACRCKTHGSETRQDAGSLARPWIQSLAAGKHA